MILLSAIADFFGTWFTSDYVGVLMAGLTALVLVCWLIVTMSGVIRK